MINLKKILVTTDLSEHSGAAFEHALSLGLLYASRIYVLYIVENSVPWFLRAGLDHAVHVEDVAMQSLMDFIHRHVGADRKVIPVVRVGRAEDEILRLAEEEGMDLVVMATHGWTGLRHMLLGSVAERVVRRSTVPVLTVKPEPMQEEWIRSGDVASQLHLE